MLAYSAMTLKAVEDFKYMIDHPFGKEELEDFGMASRKVSTLIEEIRIVGETKAATFCALP